MNQGWIEYLPQPIRSRLEGRGVLQKAVANTGWLFADKILRVIVGMVVLIWLARFLGPQKFGTLSYAIAFVALFSRVATLGLDTIVVRDIVQDAKSVESILGTAFLLRLAAGVGALVFTIGTILFLHRDDPLTYWMVAIIGTGILFQSVDVIESWFQSQILSKYAIYAKNCAFMLANMAKIVLIVIGAPVIAFAWTALAEVVIGAAGLVIAGRMNNLVFVQWRATRSLAIKLMSDSWPLILSGLAIVVYTRIDQVMLGDMVGADSVGIYSAAVRLSEGWYFVPIAIATSVFPSIVSTRKASEEMYQMRLQKLYTMMTWLAIIIAIPVTFLSHPIIQLLYGAGYEGAGTVLAIHIWAGIFVFQGYASGQYLLAENFIKIVFYRTFLGMILNVVLNYLLIPRYGASGAAVATLISQFGSAFSLIFMKYTRQQIFMMMKAFNPVPLMISVVRKR